jgi:hypothetical protein
VAAVVILTVHICLALLAYVHQSRVANPVIKAYRQLVVLGPFFAESRIRHSHFFSVQFFRDGKWSERHQPAREHFNAYAQSPWRFDKLGLIGYEKYLTGEVGKRARSKSLSDAKNPKDFRELAAFVLGEYGGGEADSVKLVYGLNEYLPHLKVYRPDTVFMHTYNPYTIGSAKK